MAMENGEIIYYRILESDTHEVNDDHVESGRKWDSDDYLPLSVLRTRFSSVHVQGTHYKSKNGHMWYNQTPGTNIGIRSENIIAQQHFYCSGKIDKAHMEPQFDF